jgi:hypothetical protein
MKDSMEDPQKPKIELSYNPAIPLVWINPKECESAFTIKTPCTPMFTAPLFIMVKLWK